MEPSSSCLHSSGSSDCTAGFSCAGEIYPKHSFLPRSTDAGKKRSGAMGPSSMFYVHDADVEVTHHFLEECSLCAKALSGDIFMYRGDTPFCSEECRQQQIEVDRAKHRRKKHAAALAASARKEQRQQQQPPRKQSSQRIPIWA